MWYSEVTIGLPENDLPITTKDGNKCLTKQYVQADKTAAVATACINHRCCLLMIISGNKWTVRGIAVGAARTN